MSSLKCIDTFFYFCVKVFKVTASYDVLILYKKRQLIDISFFFISIIVYVMMPPLTTGVTLPLIINIIGSAHSLKSHAL